MVKEAQPVCIHSSFNKMFEIFFTIKLAQFISTGDHSNKYKEKGEAKQNQEFPFFLFETTAIFKILGLKSINLTAT